MNTFVKFFYLLFLLNLFLIYPAELKFHASFDEGEGETTSDNIKQLEGKITGAQWVDGRIGKALSFSGNERSCDCVIFNDTQGDDFFQKFDDSPFSVSLWFRPDSTKIPTLTQELLSTGADLSTGWRVSYCYNKIGLFSGSEGNTKYDEVDADGERRSWWVWSNPSTDKVNPNTWNHLAVTRNNDGILMIYLNGKIAAKSAYAFKINPRGQAMTIGGYGRGYAYGFKGVIDEVKIYLGELSAEQIYKESLVVDAKTRIKLDGKLDEPLWQNAKKFSSFTILNSDAPASVQTSVLFNYDEEYLYYAFVCSEPKMASLKKNSVRNAVRDVYNDDCVELMLDCDANKADYHHILFNPLGFYGVLLHTQSGVVSSAVPNFHCLVGSSIERTAWIVETAIPYASLSREQIKNDILFNVARDRRGESKIPEESALAKRGQFNDPAFFMPLQIEKTDLSPYALVLSFPVVKETLNKNDKIEAKIVTTLKNLDNKPKELTLLVGDEKLGMLTAQPISLPGNGVKDIPVIFSITKAATYALNFTLKEKEKIVFDTTYPTKIEFNPLTIHITQPFYRNTIYATQKITEISAVIKNGLETKEYEGSETLFSFTDEKGNIIASKKTSAIEKEMIFSLPIPALDDGRYALVCKVMKNGKVIAEQKTHVDKLPTPKNDVCEVRLEKNDQIVHLLLNGKPFFPIYWYNQLRQYDYFTNSGENCGVLLGYGGNVEITMQKLDELKRLNLYGIVQPFDSSKLKFIAGQTSLSAEARDYFTGFVNRVKNHPAFLFYGIGDEPEVYSWDPKLLEELYSLIKTLDPYHPIYIVNDTVEGLYTYKDADDMFFPDPYIAPLANGSLTRPMTYPVTFMEEGKKAGEWKKFVGVIAEAFCWDDWGTVVNKNHRLLSFVEQRTYIYTSIIHGARGVCWFIANDKSMLHPVIRIGTPNVSKEVKSLSKVILIGNDLNARSSDDAVHLMVKEENGQLYIFACNVSCKTLNVEITLPKEATELKILSEERKIRVLKNKFSDKFAEYETHLYTSALDFSDVISIPKVKKEITDAGGVYEFIYEK